ncbi:MAG: 2-oxoglutarate dehydrogenase complex E2 component [Phylliscum demangeonii]|nr:MAG: 2-oxoglutarate dehydrogenase complex E2 component [Phylliscum demangeonii]
MPVSERKLGAGCAFSETRSPRFIGFDLLPGATSGRAGVKSVSTSSVKLFVQLQSRNRVEKFKMRGVSSVQVRPPTPFAARFALGPMQRRCYADQMVKVPQMAESISEGTLKQWSKKVGDRVERDEEIATIETDKIDVAVNAPAAGIIKELLAQEEDTVTVGQDLLRLEVGGGDGSSAGGAEPAPASHEIKGPASDQQPTSSDPQPSKTSKSSTSKGQDGGQPTPPTPPPSTTVTPPPTRSSEPAKERPAAPTPPSSSSSSSKTDAAAAAAPFGNREERRVKMNRMRLRIAERLKQSQNTAASLTTFNEVDMSSLMDFRRLYKDEMLKKTGVKLGFMSAFARACVLAMKDIPAANASIEGPHGGDTIVYRDYVDISVAVATEKGLVTPVVRNAERLDLLGIEREIAELGKKARDSKLTVEDMAGGTFTISNGGVFGSLMGTPIINLPQTGVLGLHAIKDKPVAINGKVEIRPMMFLALTYDHRLLDGREAVTFLVKSFAIYPRHQEDLCADAECALAAATTAQVKGFIEDPRKMLLG